MPDIPHQCKAERDAIENGLAELVCLQADLIELRLRIEQALACAPQSAGQLAPALDRLSSMSASVDLVRHDLVNAWTAGQACRWDKNQQQLNSNSSLIHGQGWGGDGLCRKGARRVA